MGDENTKEKIQAVLYVPQEVIGVYLPGPVLEGSHLRHMGQSEPASMTAPVDRSVHRMGWMIRLFFICLFTLR